MPRGKDMDKVFTRGQCAAQIGVTEQTITRMVQLGRFPDPVISHGNNVRWNKEHVNQFLQTGKVR